MKIIKISSRRWSNGNVERIYTILHLSNGNEIELNIHPCDVDYEVGDYYRG